MTALVCEGCGKEGKRRWIITGRTRRKGTTLKQPNERRVLCDPCYKAAIEQLP